MKVSLSILIILLTLGCESGKVVTERELIEFVQDPDHGLNKSAEVSGTKITISYKPLDLLVSQEIKNKTFDNNQLELLRKKYSPYYYFTVSFSQNGKEALHAQNGMDVYSDLVQTMSFKMQDYVTLTTNASDTIPVADFILNRTFGMSSSTSLLFVFNKEKSVGKEWVQFNLNEFGLNTGNQRFRFRKEDIENVPSLTFDITPTQ